PNVMIHQLRIYEIFDHNKAAFHARFRDHAARIMARHGFAIVAMWEATTEARTEFVYVLAWPDETVKRTAWAAFMADEEWQEIKRVTGAQHGPLVGAIEDRTLVPTDYAPRSRVSRSRRRCRCRTRSAPSFAFTRFETSSLRLEEGRTDETHERQLQGRRLPRQGPRALHRLRVRLRPRQQVAAPPLGGRAGGGPKPGAG